MNPIIGIVPRTMMAGSNYKVQVNYNYIEPFLERKISTIILPLNDYAMEEILNICDGFLIIGGDDIDPKYYGEENTDSKNIDVYVDLIDQKVLKHALKHKKPVLGICRGIQSIAAFLGGSLIQDIDKAGLVHDVKENSHMVNTLFINDFTKQFPASFPINSYHHQAVKNPPKDFDVIFKHNDLIEGIMHKSLPIVGVQWHPERIPTKESKILFDYFVNEVKKYHNEKN